MGRPGRALPTAAPRRLSELRNVPPSESSRHCRSPPPDSPRQPIHGGRLETALSGWLAFCQSPVNQLFSAKRRRGAPVTAPVRPRPAPPSLPSGLHVPESSAARARPGRRSCAAHCAAGVVVPAPSGRGGGPGGPVRVLWAYVGFPQGLGRLVSVWPPGSFMLPRNGGGGGGFPVSGGRMPAL